MRVSRQEMEEGHRRIVEGASKLLRRNGVRGTSVADAMKEAGLTHGGFYRHFSSKDELVTAALRQAFDELVSPIERQREAGSPAEMSAAFKALYLSEDHLRNPGQGCPMPTLGGEIARESPQLQAEFAAGVRRIIGILASGMPPRSADRQADAAVQLCTMVGAVALARASDASTARLLLDAVRPALKVSVSVSDDAASSPTARQGKLQRRR